MLGGALQRDYLISDHLDLPVVIARGLMRRLPPPFELDDLISVGRLALTQAAGRYNPGEHGGAPFIVYAKVVVRSAIIESVRRRNWDAETRPPLEDAAEPLSPDPAPIAFAERQQLLDRVAAAAQWLTSEQRAVLNLRYGPDELSLEAIGRQMGRGTTWAFDQHRAAINELRARCGGESGEESIA